MLADLVKGSDRKAMPQGFLRGVRQHQAIDAFTDTHLIVHRSQARIGDGYQHVTGILIDIFYDHFLALDWDRYCSEPLEEFTSRLYADIQSHPLPLPLDAQAIVERMCREDWLGSYRRIEGISAALCRVSTRLAARLGRDFGLEKAVAELLANFEGLRCDFVEFFPLLQAQFGKG